MQRYARLSDTRTGLTKAGVVRLQEIGYRESLESRVLIRGPHSTYLAKMFEIRGN
jgi:hypothetical protein